ncbi:MAG: hypothetical protein JO345_34595 [Streptosporangiaceae bacterium]|nr:hypothetical protein [Streptosporangiaceae bacterium]
MAQLPSALAVAAVAVLLFGLLPAWSVAGTWTAVGIAVLLVWLSAVAAAFCLAGLASLRRRDLT